jgi:hypothetical protein
LPRHLPGRILNSIGHTSKRVKMSIGGQGHMEEEEEDDDEEEQEDANNNMGRGWKKRDPSLVGSKIPPHLSPPRPAADQVRKAYKIFFWIRLRNTHQ